MQDAGMRVSPAPVRIDGRVLPAPKLVFGDNEVSFHLYLSLSKPLKNS
jgi:hypothetical protein